MGRNLSTLNIKDTYEGLVQISGSILTDGTGSVIPSLDITASYATTAGTAADLDAVYTASVIDATTTYTKGDGSTFTTLIDNVNTATSASYASTATSASHALASNTAISSSYALTASFAENVSTPTLQQVTDAGNTTTNGVIIGNGATGQLLVGNYIFPASDGTAGQAVVTDGSGNLTFSTVSSPTPTLQEVTTAGAVTTDDIILSGSLTMNAEAGGPVYFNSKYNGNNAVRMISNGTVNDIRLDNAATTNTSSIVFENVGGGIIRATGDIVLDTTSAGTKVQIPTSLNVDTSLTASGLFYPTADGTAGQVVTTDGSGALTFSTPAAGAASGLVSGSAPNSLKSDYYTTTAAIAEGSGSIAIGDNSQVTGSTSDNTIVIGKDANSKINSLRNVIVGFNARMQEDNRNDSVIIGANAAGYQEGVAVGADAFTIYQAIAIGKSAYTNGNYGIAIGAGAITNNSAGIAIGSGSLSDGNNSIAIGQAAHATAEGDVVFYNGVKNVYEYDKSTDTTNISSSIIRGSGTEQKVSLAAYGAGGINASVVNGAIIAAGDSSIAASAAYNGFIAGADSSNLNGGNNSAIVGGYSNMVNADKSVVVGGESNTVERGGSGIFAGTNNRIQLSGDRVVILGGSDNQCQSFDGAILAGSNNLINRDSAGRSVIIGGEFNIISGSSTAESWYSTIVNGQANRINEGYYSAIMGSSGSIVNSHTASVILGGKELQTSRNEEVVVPNFSIYGDTYISGSLGTGSLVDNLGQEGVGTTTEVQHIVYCTQVEYDGLTPDVNTLYVISGVGSSVNTITDSGGTSTMDCSLGNYFELNLPVGGTTELLPSNIQIGQTIRVRVVQSATIATLTFDNSIEWAGGVTPVVTASPSAVDVLTFESFGGGIIYGSISGQNFS